MIKYFPKNLRYLRKREKVNQADIAKLVGKSVQTVCAWENGTREPLVEDVFLLAQHYCVTMEELYFGELYKG